MSNCLFFFGGLGVLICICVKLFNVWTETNLIFILYLKVKAVIYVVLVGCCFTLNAHAWNFDDADEGEDLAHVSDLIILLHKQSAVTLGNLSTSVYLCPHDLIPTF